MAATTTTTAADTTTTTTVTGTTTTAAATTPAPASCDYSVHLGHTIPVLVLRMVLGTATSCQIACTNDPACTAAAFDPSSSACHLNGAPDPAAVMVPHVAHDVFIRTCLPTTTAGVTTSKPTTTTTQTVYCSPPYVNMVYSTNFTATNGSAVTAVFTSHHTTVKHRF